MHFCTFNVVEYKLSKKTNDLNIIFTFTSLDIVVLPILIKYSTKTLILRDFLWTLPFISFKVMDMKEKSIRTGLEKHDEFSKTKSLPLQLLNFKSRI